MAWCRVSSLTAAVSMTFKGSNFSMSRAKILAATAGKNVEGWELNYFLSRALKRGRYPDLKSILADLDDWLDAQG